ncbi:MAG TPA: flavin reductase family protein [Roseiarcus sp.]|nr:flavin reductase family protein [Roseiarcus sp.]
MLTSSPAYFASCEPRIEDAFRLARRELASGVCLVTHGAGETRAGLTATSVTSLSVEPPTLIVCVSRADLLYQRLATGDLFGVSVLAAHHAEHADCFASRASPKRADRFRDGAWATTRGGVSVLADAIAIFECEAEDVIERHAHAIVVGRVTLAAARPCEGALLYWRGAYDHIGWSEDEISRVNGVMPARAPSGDRGRAQVRRFK